MAYCREYLLVKHGAHEKRAVTLRCRSWTCPECAEQRKKQLVAEVVGGNPSKFLTLTCRRDNTRTAAQAAKALSLAWRWMRKKIMATYGWDELPFLAVFERHKSGWPHLHIFLRCRYIRQKDISTWMAARLNSPVQHIEQIQSSQKAAYYAAKYTSKDNVRFDGTKRYWKSRDYDQRPEDQREPTERELGNWEREKSTIDTWCQCWELAGWTVTRNSQWRATAAKPP